MKNKICNAGMWLCSVALGFCLFGAMLSGCQPCESCQTQNGSDVYLIKVCSLGDKDGESCVEHKVLKYEVGTEYLHIRTRDNERYAYNKNGWAIMFYKRSRRD